MPNSETSKLGAELNLQRWKLRLSLVTARQEKGGPLPSWDRVYDVRDYLSGYFHAGQMLEDW